jgi:general stress protein 26
VNSGDSLNTQERLDYASVRQAKVEFLDGHMLAALATSADDRVTARTVDYASKGLDIYFLSWEHHTKCVQIKTNPRVALCIDNMQIEGRAKILGNPIDAKNSKAADIYRSKLPIMFNDFASRPGMVIVKVIPDLIVTFVRSGSRRYWEYLDQTNKTAYVAEEFHRTEPC